MFSRSKLTRRRVSGECWKRERKRRGGEGRERDRERPTFLCDSFSEFSNATWSFFRENQVLFLCHSILPGTICFCLLMGDNYNLCCSKCFINAHTLKTTSINIRWRKITTQNVTFNLTSPITLKKIPNFKSSWQLDREATYAEIY